MTIDQHDPAGAETGTGEGDDGSLLAGTDTDTDTSAGTGTSTDTSTNEGDEDDDVGFGPGWQPVPDRAPGREPLPRRRGLLGGAATAIGGIRHSADAAVSAVRSTSGEVADGLRDRAGGVVRAGTEGTTSWVAQGVAPDLLDQMTPYLVEELVPKIVDGLIPHLADEVVPEVLDRVTPILVGQVVPQVVDGLVPYLSDQVVPAVLDRVTPMLSEQVVPAVVDGLVPYLSDQIVPAIIDRVTPHLVDEVVPRVLTGIMPLLNDEVVPAVIGGVVDDPRLTELIVSQSRSFVSDINNEFVARSSAHDDRIERATRRVVHLPRRQEAAPPPMVDVDGDGIPDDPDAAGTTRLYPDVPYAGLLSRLLALGIDLFVVVLLVVGSSSLAIASYQVLLGEPADSYKAATALACAQLPWIYFTLSWGLLGRTVGNLLLGTEVVTTYGHRLKVRRALPRAFVGLLLAPYWMVGLVIGVLREPSRRAWHDRVFRTTVRYVPQTRGRVPAVARPTAVPPLPDTGVPAG